MHAAVKWGLWGIALSGGAVGTYLAFRGAGLVGELPRAEGDSLIVNTLTLNSSKQDFVRGVMSAAASSPSSLSVSTRMLITAWGALESGWGKTRQAKLGFNLWNVSKGGWTGPTIPGADTEFAPGDTKPKAITQAWRQYGSVEASVNDLLNMLKTSRFVNYREAYEDLVRGEPGFATRLGVFERVNGVITRVDTRPNTAGFYTLPRSEYQAHVSALYRDVGAIVAQASIAGLTAGTQS